MLPITNKKAAGTKLSTILARDKNNQNADGTPNNVIINRLIDAEIIRQTRLSRSTIPVDTVQLRPLRDTADKVIDFRVEMDHATESKLLQPDLEFQNVYANMQSDYVNKKNSIPAAKKTIDELVAEQVERMPEDTASYINIIDSDGKYFEQYLRIPKEIRMYMQQYVLNGKFMVREDIVNKVFGFPSADFEDVKFLQKDSMAAVLHKIRIAHNVWKLMIAYYKDRIIIATPAVGFRNILSNLGQLIIMQKIPASYVGYKLIEGFEQYKEYVADSTEKNRLKKLIKDKRLSDSSSAAIQFGKLHNRLPNNKVHKLVEAGIASVIVEDLNLTSDRGYIDRIQQNLQADQFTKYSDKIPDTAMSIARASFLTKNNAIYKGLREVVSMTDFLARYVQIEYNTQVLGQDFESAKHDAMTAFINFDEISTPAIDFLDTNGFTIFAKYYLRVQRVARQMLKQTPTGVGVSVGVEALTGAPTSHILPSAIPFNSPSGFQQWDAFKSLFDPAGVKALGLID